MCFFCETTYSGIFFHSTTHSGNYICGTRIKKVFLQAINRDDGHLQSYGHGIVRTSTVLFV